MSNVDAIETTIAVLLAEAESLEQFDGVPLQRAINFGLYVLLLERDFACLDADSGMLRDAKMASRLRATLVYEAFQDIPRLLGREFRAACRVAELEPGLFKRLNELMRDFNALKQANAADLKRIRNFVLAHRDLDALAQARTLQSVSPATVDSTVSELRVLLDAALDWVTSVILHFRSPAAMVKAVPLGR